MIQVAVFGYGTVGSGVVEVIEKNKDMINKKAGDGLNIKYVLDLRDFPGDPVQEKLVKDVTIILDDPEVDIICETMGGINPAYDFTKRALLKGKSVCTSNKELVASHGPELLRLARENKCNYLFEASVGGGIPIIRPLNYSLTAEKIDGITGILNGTTNYILTKMDREGADFDDVLKEAQEKGYAEKNPEADVEGYDACRKIAILTSLVIGQQVNFEDIYTEGIAKITAEDMKYIKKMGMTVKLLATSKKQDGNVYVYVAPVILSPSHPLYSVNDVFNAVFVHGNMLGDAMFYGSGAGKLPTASAVVADVVAAVKEKETVRVIWKQEKANLADISGIARSFFVRAKGDASKARAIFGEIKEIEANIDDEYGFVTSKMTEREFEEKAEQFGCMISRIRMA